MTQLFQKMIMGIINTEEIASLIIEKANKYTLDIPLFASLIYHESDGGNPWAVKVEEEFYSKYLFFRTKATLSGFIPNDIQTDKRLRSISWGLCQIMGETARELGFKEKFLPMLLDPKLNLEYGAKYLGVCRDKSSTERLMLLRWNGGGDENYPERVFKIREDGLYKGLIGQ